MDQINLEMRPEGLFNLLPLAFAEQPMVDEDARQLVANGCMNQGGRYSRVDTA
jgi:hypothetical protein